MAASVNKVILLGNLGADPEIREFPSGAKYCRLRVATSERWKDRNTGENREQTEWHNVTIYSENLARIAGQYLRKGEKVYLEGKLETRKWQDQEGRDRYSTEVALRGFGSQMCLLGARGDAPSGGDPYTAAMGDDAQSALSGQRSRDRTGSSGDSGSFSRPDDIDDDIPF